MNVITYKDRIVQIKCNNYTLIIYIKSIILTCWRYNTYIMAISMLTELIIVFCQIMYFHIYSDSI